MTLKLTVADWDRLRELRAVFLEAQGRQTPCATPDYFRSQRDVELYDLAFARRIEWKWAAALREVELRAPSLRPQTLVDWACGAGQAARSVLASPLGERVTRVTLFDRSTRALDYARRSLLEQRPKLKVDIARAGAPVSAELLVASHVIDELDAEGEAQLEGAVRASQAAIVLESGARGSSRRLGELRARLTDAFTPIAPCTHAATCGVLASEKDWCHFFARPPASVFQDPFWAEYSRELGVDLRSLAYSFVALARSPAPVEPGLTRILGRPRMLKGRALLDACSQEGVKSISMLQRLDRELFKSLDGATNEPRVWRIELDGARVSAAQPQFPPGG